MNEYSLEVGKRLRELREEKGVSAIKAAPIIGVGAYCLYAYERGGKTCPDIETAYRMANYYGVSIDYIACLTDERNKTETAEEEPETSEEKTQGQKRKKGKGAMICQL